MNLQISHAAHSRLICCTFSGEIVKNHLSRGIAQFLTMLCICNLLHHQFLHSCRECRHCFQPPVMSARKNPDQLCCLFLQLQSPEHFLPLADQMLLSHVSCYAIYWSKALPKRRSIKTWHRKRGREHTGLLPCSLPARLKEVLMIMVWLLEIPIWAI